VYLGLDCFRVESYSTTARGRRSAVMWATDVGERRGRARSPTREKEREEGGACESRLDA